jgi:FAD/FMN-containing dehydrogenase
MKASGFSSSSPSLTSSRWTERLTSLHHLENEFEVVNLIREASQQGWKVAVRSGGHSWIASSVRAGGLLLDMSAFKSISIDATTRTAKVGPAVRSAELVKALAAAADVVAR